MVVLLSVRQHVNAKLAKNQPRSEVWVCLNTYSVNTFKLCLIKAFSNLFESPLEPAFKPDSRAENYIKYIKNNLNFILQKVTTPKTLT